MQRDLWYEQGEAETEPDSEERERRKTIAVVDALDAGGLLSKREAKRLRDYFERAKLTLAEWRKDRDDLWRNTVGQDLADLRSLGVTFGG